MFPVEIRVFREDRGGLPLLDWLAELRKKRRKAYDAALARILMLEENGVALGRPHAAPLRDGIYELRWRDGNVQLRILYFFSGGSVVVLSHGFAKEGAVPTADIMRAKSRKALVKQNPNKYTADFGIDNG